MKTNKTYAKKLLLSLFAMLMPLLASAYDFEVDGVCYRITSSVDFMVEVTYKGSLYNSQYSGDINIPSHVSNDGKTYQVISIGENAFDNSSIASILIEEGITTIKDEAFWECKELKTVILPQSVNSIGYGAFCQCSNLASINIPSGITELSKNVFYECDNLKSITIPKGVTKIDNWAFYGCDRLVTISIPEGVTTIGEESFRGCSSMTSLYLPSSITYIGDDAFFYCKNLISVYINNLEAWCNIEFYGMNSNPLWANANGSYPYASKSSLYINEKVIKELIIPSTISEIKNFAFSGCGSLTGVDIPKGVLTIGSDAFYGCNNVTFINISEGVTVIKEGGFRKCNNLVSVTIPKSVVSIGNYAFNECTSLTNVVFEDGDMPLSLGYSYYDSDRDYDGKGAFFYCPLERVYLGRNIEYKLGNWYGFSPFYNIATLKSLEIGSYVNSIKNNAFEGCVNLANAHFHSNPSIASSSFPENTLKKLNIADYNSIDFNMENANNFANITYHRELASGKYGTIMLPFSPDAESLENFAFYSLTSAENDMLIFDEVEAPQANTPYLFSLREGKSAIQIAGGETTISSEITNPEEVNGWQMIGSFTNQTIATSEDADNYYYAYTSADNQLHKVTNTLNVKPYRAYFVTDTANPAQLAVRTRNGETTLIDAAEVEDLATGTYYDLSGRRVENPTKGLYIVNGKKVIL